MKAALWAILAMILIAAPPRQCEMPELELQRRWRV